MLVKDLIKYLSRYNENSPVWIASEKENKLLDIYEVTNGTVEGSREFVVVIPKMEEEDTNDRE